MTAEVPSIHVYYSKDLPANPPARNGYAKKIALIGAFDTTEENPKLFNTLTEATDTFGDDTTNYKGCKVLEPLFNGASSILAVNITTETTDTSGSEPVTTREKDITTTKLTNALAKIKGEDWDILFIADNLTADFLPIITHLLDEVAEMKYPAGFIGAINAGNVSANVALASLAGEHCYGLINQSFEIAGTSYDLLYSAAYYCGLIAGLYVGNSMTNKRVNGVTGVTPELSFETAGDGKTLLEAGITTFKCQDRNTNTYVVVNSEQPNELDLYINRVRDYVVKEMNLNRFLGDRNRPKTLNQVIQELDRIKYNCVDTLDLLKDIKYWVEKESAKHAGIHIDELLFDDILTRINVYVRVKIDDE